MSKPTISDDYKLWKDAYEAKEIKVIWHYFYDKRFNEICRTRELCYTNYLFNQKMEQVNKYYSQYGPVEVKVYKLLEGEQ